MSYSDQVMIACLIPCVMILIGFIGAVIVESFKE